MARPLRIELEDGLYHVTTARRAYRRFVAGGLDEPLDSPLDQAVHGVVLGAERFVERVRRLLDQRSDEAGIPSLRRMRKVPAWGTIIELTARAFGEDAGHWRPGRRDDSIARAVAAYVARRRFGYPAGQTAQVPACTAPSSVTRAVQRVERNLPRLSGRLAKIERA